MLRKKAQLAALGEWTHIDGLRRGSRDRVQDDILRNLMYEFNPEQLQSSRLDTSSDSSGVPLNRVPGGTISFIFERFSATVEKGNGGEPGSSGSS